MSKRREDVRTREPQAGAGPSGPAEPHLEIDELLDQALARSAEVRATRDQVRGLLRAVTHVGADLDLDEVLHRLVDAARDLAGSRWAALGLLHEGRMTQVVHRREDEPVVGMLRRLPDDTGVLGWRVDDPRVARIEDLTSHPDARPEVRGRDPEVRSFLRAPVRAGSTTYGNLYLADDRAGVFDEDDERLVAALASAAAVAVQNAVLLTRARREQRWTQAATELATHLLAQDIDLREGWQALLEVAVDVADADGATLTSIDPADPHTIEVVAAAGSTGIPAGARRPDGISLTGAVLDSGEALLVRDAPSDPRTGDLGSLVPNLGSVLAAPLPDHGSTSGGVQSVVALIRTADRPAFRDLEIDVVKGFAAQAAAILTVARARHDRERLARLEDREELLTGLQHTVFSQLQRSTLTLANIAAQLDPSLRRLLLDQIDVLERLVRSIRDTIFDVPR